jgi:hypothetical protein
MLALVLQLCGGVFALSTVGFLSLAWKAKLRPDLEEPEFDLEKIFLATDQLSQCREAENDPYGDRNYDIVVRFVPARPGRRRASRPRSRTFIHQHRLV